MEDFKGSKGIWKVEEHSWSDTSVLCNEKTVCSISISEEATEENQEELENEALSNANLISAAPELLAACQEFIRKCEAGEARSVKSLAQMKLAVAKALGQE